MPYKPPTPQENYEKLIRKTRESPAGLDPYEGLDAEARALLTRGVNAYRRHQKYLEASEREYTEAKHIFWKLRELHKVSGARIAFAVGVSRQRIDQLFKQMRDVYEPRRTRAKAGKVVRPHGANAQSNPH